MDNHWVQVQVFVCQRETIVFTIDAKCKLFARQVLSQKPRKKTIRDQDLKISLCARGFSNGKGDCVTTRKKKQQTRYVSCNKCYFASSNLKASRMAIN